MLLIITNEYKSGWNDEIDNKIYDSSCCNPDEYDRGWTDAEDAEFEQKHGTIKVGRPDNLRRLVHILIP